MNDVMTRILDPVSEGGRGVQESTARNYITAVSHYVDFIELTYPDGSPLIAYELTRLKTSLHNVLGLIAYELTRLKTSLHNELGLPKEAKGHYNEESGAGPAKYAYTSGCTKV